MSFLSSCEIRPCLFLRDHLVEMPIVGVQTTECSRKYIERQHMACQPHCIYDCFESSLLTQTKKACLSFFAFTKYVLGKKIWTWPKKQSKCSGQSTNDPFSMDLSCHGKETETLNGCIWSWWTTNQALFCMQSPSSQLYSSKLQNDGSRDEMASHAACVDCEAFLLTISLCSYSQQMYKAF